MPTGSTRRNVAASRAAIDCGHVHEDLHRNGVTLQLLWSEYLDRVAPRGDGTKPYQYSKFCELYGFTDLAYVIEGRSILGSV